MHNLHDDVLTCYWKSIIIVGIVLGGPMIERELKVRSKNRTICIKEIYSDKCFALKLSLFIAIVVHATGRTTLLGVNHFKV